jgi:hypothetical protein
VQHAPAFEPILGANVEDPHPSDATSYLLTPSLIHDTLSLIPDTLSLSLTPCPLSVTPYPLADGRMGVFDISTQFWIQQRRPESVCEHSDTVALLDPGICRSDLRWIFENRLLSRTQGQFILGLLHRYSSGCGKAGALVDNFATYMAFYITWPVIWKAMLPII